jgi:hypothetical protein
VRCITAEEREILLVTAHPVPETDDGAAACDGWSDGENSALDRLERVGNVAPVNRFGLDFSVITPRGRLALACHAAVNVRMG